jgi:hypothetical protein
MNTIDPKLTQAMEYVVKAQQIMTELGHTKYTICGMVSKQMLHDSEQEVSVLLGELHKLTEQRDRLTEAIRKHRDELELTSGESVNRMLWNTLAAVKENQKTDSQSCPECDALASYGSNDGPCETHKL